MRRRIARTGFPVQPARIFPVRAAILIVMLAAVAPSSIATAQAQSINTRPENRYETILLRLSEILGSVHFLSNLCDSDEEPGIWRRQMEALLEAESAFPQRRRLMTIRFNRGYSSFTQVYRTCTPSAKEALDRYRAEGGEITQELVAFYGRQ